MNHTTSKIPKPDTVYRVLHTADWHLGKMLNDRSREPEFRLFLEWLLQTVEENAVDAVLIAGDLFDTANPSNDALQLYYDFAAGLFKSGERALAVVAGNHDSAAQLAAPRRALRSLNVHVHGFLEQNPMDRLLLLPDETNPRVIIAMIPFLRDRDLRVGTTGEQHTEIRAQLVSGIERVYAETAEAVTALGLTCPAIATGHLTVVGSSTSDSEREIHIGGLGSVSPAIFPAEFEYVALGHLHRPQTVGPDDRVCYTGSPIALSFSEAGDVKQVQLLDVDARSIRRHALPLPVIRRLARMRTSLMNLESSLDNFQPQIGELPTWVEILIEDTATTDDIHDRVMKQVAGSDFEVLRVVREHSLNSSPIDSDQWTDEQAIDTLIEKPARVFDELLDRQIDLDEKAKTELRSAFTELLELYHHRDAEPKR